MHEDLLVVDTHVHVGLTKYGPVQQYTPDMDLYGVDRAVLVQYLGNSENGYLEECVQGGAGRFAAIAMVDERSAEAPEIIDRLAARDTVVGVRLSATARSPGNDPLAVWRALDRNGLVASIHGPYAEVVDPSFKEVLDELPCLAVRLEHLGSFRFNSGEDFDRLLRLAEYPQVVTMWSGFYQLSSTGYPYPDAHPFLRASLSAFSAKRIMWSGDWNAPHLKAEWLPREYGRAVPLITDHLPFLTDDDKRWVLGQTATSWLDFYAQRRH